MKCFILLENHFLKDKNNIVWCERTVDYNYLKRYLNVFDEIVVCGRFSNTKDDCSKKLLVSGNNVTFLELPDFRGIKGLAKNYLKIRKLINKSIKTIDCCIMRFPTHLSYISYSLFIKNKIPLAIEFMMAPDKMVEGNSIIVKLINKFLIAEAKKICLKANGVSYVTDYILQRQFPCSAMLNINNNSYFTANYSSIDLYSDMYYKQKWSSSSKPEIFRIIHTGYMDSYRKGQDTLIKAVKILTDKGYKNIKVILIGDGQKRSEFENLARELNILEFIEFKGLIEKKDKLMDELKQSHLFVFPTHSEGLPRSIIEAMAVSLPCISSPVDGVPELLDDEDMYDYNDINGYAQCIITYIENWDKMIEKGKNNYKKARKYKKENLDIKRKNFYERLADLV